MLQTLFRSSAKSKVRRCVKCFRAGHVMSNCIQKFSIFGEDLARKYCERCGALGHVTTNCSAEFDIFGNKILLKPCVRCGRYGHVENNCVAEYSLNGDAIVNATSGEKGAQKLVDKHCVSLEVETGGADTGVKRKRDFPEVDKGSLCYPKWWPKDLM